MSPSLSPPTCWKTSTPLTYLCHIILIYSLTHTRGSLGILTCNWIFLFPLVIFFIHSFMDGTTLLLSFLFFSFLLLRMHSFHAFFSINSCVVFSPIMHHTLCSLTLFAFALNPSLSHLFSWIGLSCLMPPPLWPFFFISHDQSINHLSLHGLSYFTSLASIFPFTVYQVAAF